jgi:hypothetical protein
MREKEKKNGKRRKPDKDLKKAKVTPTRLGFLKSRHPLCLKGKHTVPTF